MKKKALSPEVMMYYSELANCSAAQLGSRAVAEGKDEANMNNRKIWIAKLLTEAQ